MSGVFLDTDILVDFLRGRTEARELIRTISNQSTAYCSVITVAELFAGMRPSEELATRRLLEALVIVPVTVEVAQKAGELKRLAKRHALELDDCLIAASAMLEQSALATKNAKHYPFDELSLIAEPTVHSAGPYALPPGNSTRGQVVL